MQRAFWVTASTMVFFATGCATRLGPGSIKQSHRPYNDSVIETLNEQLLLNLVRLKYRDNPYFIEITSITTSQSIEGSVGGAATLRNFRNTAVSAGSTYSDKPTISYQPLQGEEFIQKLMAPVPIQGILKLTQSGWSIERVMRLAVEQANNIQNAPSASGPTPKRPPEYLEFRGMVEKLGELQRTYGLNVALSGTDVAMTIDPSRISREDGLEVRRMLRLDPRGSQVILTDKPERRRGPDDLFLQTRSVSGILFFLSHSIEVPQAHIDKGLVTTTQYSNGAVFDWNDVTGDLLKVKSSVAPPVDAFVKLRYRGNWFYIEDNDLESKSTFMLLNQLFNLLAGDIKKAAPVLTIPVG
ncbi:MAG: hypothetical protein P1U58_10365 [Verrucomicrobiales bacterium]|nr:hypothetical protein [Verrucomicrobiales bacterium]